MVYYNPKDWLLPIFRIHKSDTFRKLFGILVFIALYSWGVVYLEVHYLKLSQNSNARNVTVMHTLLGFAISMLLVFRTNTAYDRWWEGRKLWGHLVNNSRNLALKLQVFLRLEDDDNRAFFRKAIPLYALSLKKHLLKEELVLDGNDPALLPSLTVQAQHMPNKIAEQIIGRIHQLYVKGSISGDQLIVLNEEMRALTDVCGACERIKNTPIPYSYSAFIKKFIFLYVITLPIGFAFNLGYFTIPVTTFIFYVLASLELIAEEIEDPFGKDSNDLPMLRMAENIRSNVEEIIVVKSAV
jgi:ion channel-forming bestrophin family protein